MPNGKKLPPLIIFKGQKNKTIEKQLNNLDLVKNKKIFIACQNNAWCDCEIFIKWLTNIYEKYVLLTAKNECILILDKAPSHTLVKVSDFIQSHKLNVVYIPPGCTRILQPLDIGINKEIKQALKEKYLKYQLENKEMVINNLFKISRELLIQLCYEIWYDNDIIKLETIKNSFTKAGISFPMDGSKDDDFVFPEETEIKHSNIKKNKNIINNSIKEEHNELDNDNLSNAYLNKDKVNDIEKSLENNINNFINEINDIKIDNIETEKTESNNDEKKEEEFENLLSQFESLYLADIDKNDINEDENGN